MFRYRDHRGSLDASLATAQTMNSIDDLSRHIAPLFGKGLIEVKDYGIGIDTRCGWHTHLVTHNGNAVGFTDGPVEI